MIFKYCFFFNINTIIFYIFFRQGSTWPTPAHYTLLYQIQICLYRKRIFIFFFNCKTKYKNSKKKYYIYVYKKKFAYVFVCFFLECGVGGGGCKMEEQRDRSHSKGIYIQRAVCRAAVVVLRRLLRGFVRSTRSPGPPDNQTLLDQLTQLTLPLSLSLEDLMTNLEQDAVTRCYRCRHWGSRCAGDITALSASVAQLLHKQIHIMGRCCVGL